MSDREMPSKSSNTERLPFENAIYTIRLLEVEPVSNRYYHPEKWTDEDGKERRADDPIEETQFKFKWEVAEGEKKGDWLWCFAPHWFTADGKGKRAKIALALYPDFDLSDGLTPYHVELTGGVCKAFIEPKDDPKYCRIVKFIALKDKERKSLLGSTLEESLGATVIEEKPEVVASDGDKPEEIPF